MNIVHEQRYCKSASVKMLTHFWSLVNNYILINTYHHQDKDFLNIADLK